MTKFIVIQQFAWCNDGGCGIEYASDLEEHDTRAAAIEHGFCLAGCDDFNIGVIEADRLVSFDYMEKPVGNGRGVNGDTLAQIAELIGMEREHPAIQLCSLTHVCDEVAAQLSNGDEK